MRCTDKEQETCQVEKMGCKGCAYYEEETVVYEDDSTNCRHANMCVGSCRCGAKSEKDCERFEKDERSIWERGHDDGWIHKDKIKEMKEFYINEYTNKNITLIPLKNIIENINVLLEEK